MKTKAFLSTLAVLSALTSPAFAGGKTDVDIDANLNANRNVNRNVNRTEVNNKNKNTVKNTNTATNKANNTVKNTNTATNKANNTNTNNNSNSQGQGQGQLQGQGQKQGQGQSQSAVASQGQGQSQGQSANNKQGQSQGQSANNTQAQSANNSQGQSANNSQGQSANNSQGQTANNNGNAQDTYVDASNRSVNTMIELPEAAVAPLPANNGGVGGIGDIVVPLPGFQVGAFYSNDDNAGYGNGTSRNAAGVTAGFSVPLGAGEFREAARNEVRSRAASQRVQLIKEAVWLQKNGIKVTAETFPEHYAALGVKSEMSEMLEEAPVE